MHTSISRNLLRAVAALVLMVLATHPGAAQLAQPQGEVVLTLAGPQLSGNDGNIARFDMQMLEERAHTEFVTSTVWTEGPSHFRGILMHDLLKELGVASGPSANGVLTAQAIDGYSATIPLDELHEDGPIIAIERDGARMPVRDKGPLWIVFPFDTNPRYRSETVYSRSVWQLNLIEIGD